MTSGELIELVKRDLKTAATEWEDYHYHDAVEQSQRDTGWVLPQTGDFQITWLVKRTKRHLFYARLSETSEDFRYKQIHLQQVWEHYREMVRQLDEEWLLAKDEHMDEFLGVNLYELFGHTGDAGFSYDELGRNTTYDKDNEVFITPTKN